MIQYPNPKDDPEMEKFIGWLTTEGHESCTMSFQRLKEVWLKGMCEEIHDRIIFDRPDPGTYITLCKEWRKRQEEISEFQIRRDVEGYNLSSVRDLGRLPVAEGNESHNGGGRGIAP